MFTAKDFVPEHDAFIVMAHYRSHKQNDDKSWSYSEKFCYEQFCRAYPKLHVPYKTFCKYKHDLIRKFENNYCICKTSCDASLKQNIKKSLPSSKLSLKVIGTKELFEKYGENISQSLKSNKISEQNSDADVSKITVSNELFKKLSKRFHDISEDLNEETNVRRSDKSSVTTKKNMQRIISEEQTPDNATSKKLKTYGRENNLYQNVPKVPTAVQTPKKKNFLTSGDQKNLHQNMSKVTSNLQNPTKLWSRPFQCPTSSTSKLITVKKVPGMDPSRIQEIIRTQYGTCDDESDGVEELDFPTDLPLPNPEIPTSGEFTLCPITGKLVGVDYSTEEEITKEVSSSNMEFAPVTVIIDPEEEPQKETMEAEDPLKDTMETEDILKDKVKFEDNTSVLRLVPFDKLKKSEDLNSGTCKIIEKVPSEIKSVAQVTKIKKSIFMNDHKKKKHAKSEEFKFKPKNVVFKPVQIKMNHKNSPTLNKLPFPNQLPKAMTNRKRTHPNSNQPPNCLTNVTSIQGSSEKKTSHNLKKMVLIRKFKPGMKPIGGRVILKKNIFYSACNTPASKIISEIDDSINIVKAEPTEVLEII